MMTIPTNTIKALLITRCTSASISFFASLNIAAMIIRSTKRRGLKSPYSRIIFFMSIADICGSLGFLLSPFLSPKQYEDFLFSRGTVESCEAVGFVLLIGVLTVPMCTVFLTYYFLRRIRYKVKPEDFAKREERYIIPVICIIAFGSAMVAYITKSINPSEHGEMCTLSRAPYDCIYHDDVDCIRGDNIPILSLGLYVINPLIGFFMLIVILGLFTKHVFDVERELEKTLEKRKLQALNRIEEESLEGSAAMEGPQMNNVEEGRQAGSERNGLGLPATGENNANPFSYDDDIDDIASMKKGSAFNDDLFYTSDNDKKNDIQPNISGTYKKCYETVQFHMENSQEKLSEFEHEQAAEDNDEEEKTSLTTRAFVQSSLYVGVFMLTYSVPIVKGILGFLKVDSPISLDFAGAILVPLSGLFNILIYTRPKVQVVQEIVPDVSWFICFIVIIWYGGEIPPANEITSSKKSKIKKVSDGAVGNANAISIGKHSSIQEALAASKNFDEFRWECLA